MSFSFKVQGEETVQRGGRGGKEKTRKGKKKESEVSSSCWSLTVGFNAKVRITRLNDETQLQKPKVQNK